MNKARNPEGKGGWQPGESGNPGGRPLAALAVDGKTIELRDLARRNTRTAFATILTIMRDKGNAANVRLTAAAMVLERGHGKPIQPVSNPDLSPLDLGNMSDDDLVKLAARTSQAASALAASTKH